MRITLKLLEYFDNVGLEWWKGMDQYKQGYMNNKFTTIHMNFISIVVNSMY